jgi:hypothetical protein
MDRPRADRCLEVARELRAAAEETRRTLQASRDLVRRSREQAVTGPSAPPGDDPGPSQHLVTSLIEAYEAADDDPDPQTRLLLGRVLHHVGRRVAGVMGPRAAGVTLQ